MTETTLMETVQRETVGLPQIMVTGLDECCRTDVNMEDVPLHING